MPVQQVSVADPLTSKPEQSQLISRINGYHRIVILTEAHTNYQYAKTAIALLRYRTADIVAILDSTQVGRQVKDLIGQGDGIPIVSSLKELDDVDAMFIGISPSGGRLPAAMQAAIREAIEAGIDVVSGLHDFISEDVELKQLAEESGSTIIDVRKNNCREVARHATFNPECLRIHTVGHDCSVGKMIASKEIELELIRRGIDARFLATGQTGIMIAGNGIPIDCTVSDFLNGSAEQLVLDHQHHEIVLIEGQGCITHPAYSGVTLGLLHGSAPQGLILCYEAGRETVKNLDHVPIPSLKQFVSLYETIASARHPCKIIGIAMNGRRLSPEEGELEKQKVSAELGLPVCDVFRDGAAVLADAILEFQKEAVQ
ncbi:MAG TPA: DUF1611 domain-containing protein [Planctomycetaceae bacterium]|nr:DUF1611 domain-containing protein [Planctomycetaceae bacterium]